MLTGINLAETRDYISRNDPDKQNPTVFKIGVLDAFARSYLQDKAASFDIDTKNPDSAPAVANVKDASNKIMTVRLGVKAIENFLDPQTQKPLQFNLVTLHIGGKNYQALPERVISMMTDDLIRELADVVNNANVLDEEAEKN